uniref:ATP synthase F0 subunit 8 n=1 Tax=Pseudeuphausia sinica TaxID=296748 RepID=A0A5Q2MVF6_9EUCA|nr:ATP synthase F0 subunit 8 [Pseudeuphausia sinica]QGG46157.1 ATP synthase F0 subunit 8 [Pseudeuphausia sinica]
MPQMAPMLWLNLFILFSSMFLIFMAVNYFTKIQSKLPLPSPPTIKTEMKWKW